MIERSAPPFRPGDRVIALGEIPETVVAVDQHGAELAGGGYATFHELQPDPVLRVSPEAYAEDEAQAEIRRALALTGGRVVSRKGWQRTLYSRAPFFTAAIDAAVDQVRDRIADLIARVEDVLIGERAQHHPEVGWRVRYGAAETRLRRPQVALARPSSPFWSQTFDRRTRAAAARFRAAHLVVSRDDLALSSVTDHRASVGSPQPSDLRGSVG